MAFECSNSSLSPSPSPSPFEEKYREVARQAYGVEGEIEIDPGAEVSASSEGAYVAAWIWVDRREVDPLYDPFADSPIAKAIGEEEEGPDA